MTVRDVYEIIDRLAPFSAALDWDNSGLQVGDWSARVDRVLVALDATPQVLEEAAGAGAQLVVTHHPLLFEPVRQLAAPHPAFLAARLGVAVLSAHTNYDLAPRGVNAQLAAALGLADTEPLPDVGGAEPPVGLVGNLPKEASTRALAQALEGVLGVRPRYNPLDRTIRRVALCGGAGADFVAAGQAAGGHAFLTGEAKHHQFLDAHARGIVLFDGTHYATEALAMPFLADYLRAHCPGATVELARAYDGLVVDRSEK